MWDNFIQVIVDVLLWLPRMIYSLLADSIAFFMGLLPNESIDLQGALNGWSGDVLYFLTLFEIPFGVTLILTALGARFILRRIPVIG